MIPYKTRTKKLVGSSDREIWKKVKEFYFQIKGRTKRKPYVRSTYFNKQKIFFDFFWRHLSQKSPRQRRIRLRYFPCAINLIRNSRSIPSTSFAHQLKTPPRWPSLSWDSSDGGGLTTNFHLGGVPSGHLRGGYQKSAKLVPSSKINPNKKTEILHRFTGITKDRELFFVQIKENTKTDRKYLMSVFPAQ